MILQVGITENAVALQLPKDADHDLCVAAAADYNDCIHALPGLQKSLRDSGWLAIHVPFQKGWQLGCLIGTQFRHLPDPGSQSFALIKVLSRC